MRPVGETSAPATPERSRHGRSACPICSYLSPSTRFLRLPARLSWPPSERTGSRANDLEVQELFEGIEVAVGVEECMRFAQAERRDEAVDRLPDRAASLT